MVFLPVVARELRAASRRSMTYWARAWAAGPTLALGAYFLSVFDQMGPLPRRMGMGYTLVTSLAGIAFFYACSTGIRQCADAIAYEKREGTLGFLFLTDLRGYDIALGKLCGASLASFYLMLANFPILMLAVMVGGMEGGAIVRCGLALVNMLFFANAVSLLVSVFCRQARQALGWATLFLAGYLGGLALAAASSDKAGALQAAAFFTMINPAQTWLLAASSHIRTAPFWWSLLSTHCIGWSFLAMASWRLPWSWQDKGAREDVGWRAKWRQWCYGPPPARTAFRRKLLRINPFFWVISRQRLGPALVWLTFAAIITVALCKANAWFSPGEAILPLVVTLHTILKVWTAAESTFHLDAQRRNGSLEMLLACTPMTPLNIVQGQWCALRRMFLWPVVAVLAIDLFLVFAPSISGGFNLLSHPVLNKVQWAILAAMIVLLADLLALGWIGMWQAMRQSRPRRAFGSAVSQVLIWPWAVFAFLEMLDRNDRNNGFAELVTLWLFVSLVMDIPLALRARRLLFEQFRELAARPFDSGRGWMAWAGGALGRLWARRPAQRRYPSV